MLLEYQIDPRIIISTVFVTIVKKGNTSIGIIFQIFIFYIELIKFFLQENEINISCSNEHTFFKLKFEIENSLKINLDIILVQVHLNLFWEFQCYK